MLLQLKMKPLVVPEFKSTDPVIGGGALGGESVNELGRRARATGMLGTREELGRRARATGLLGTREELGRRARATGLLGTREELGRRARATGLLGTGSVLGEGIRWLQEHWKGRWRAISMKGDIHIHMHVNTFVYM